MCVSLSASISQQPLDRSSRNVVCRFPVAWSSSGGVAIRYLLPVLWMTSCLAIVNCMMMCGRLAALRYRANSDVCECLVVYYVVQVVVEVAEVSVEAAEVVIGGSVEAVVEGVIEAAEVDVVSTDVGAVFAEVDDLLRQIL